MKPSILLALAFAPTLATAQITFDSSFECGNATGFTETAPGAYDFAIEPDTASDDRQWFYFAANGAEGQTLTFTIVNAGDTNVPSHWSTAVPVFSTDDGETWTRTTGATSRTSTTYTFAHTFQTNAERIAFHDPYPFSRAETKIPEWAAHPHAESTVLGQSIQGRDMTLFRITDPSTGPEGKIGVWVIARQHAAEVTGSWTMEGFMDFLLSDAEEARALRANALVNVVPFMNPDGATAGNYRDNFHGVNLNRVWDGSATMADSPEVVLARQAIDAWAAGDNDYSWFFDFHSTSGGSPHFAFHAAVSTSSVEYNAISREFLGLVESFAPHFDADGGESSSNDSRLAYHSQRKNHGVQAFTPEGTYNRQFHGPTPNAPQTPETHREVGAAFAKALVEYHELEAPRGNGMAIK